MDYGYSADLSEFSDWLNQSAYLIESEPWYIYRGLSSSTLTLTEVPSSSFRCKVKLSSAPSHTDCTGTVNIGSEVLTFTEAGEKISTTLNSSVPVITTSNINCYMEIAAIDRVGTEIQKERLVDIDCRWIDKTLWFQGEGGVWMNTNSMMFVKGEIKVGIGSKIKFDKNDPRNPLNGIIFIVKGMGNSVNELGATIIKRLDF